RSKLPLDFPDTQYPNNQETDQCKQNGSGINGIQLFGQSIKYPGNDKQWEQGQRSIHPFEGDRRIAIQNPLGIVCSENIHRTTRLLKCEPEEYTEEYQYTDHNNPVSYDFWTKVFFLLIISIVLVGIL